MPLTTEPVTRAPEYGWALFGRVTVLEAAFVEAELALSFSGVAEMGEASVKRAAAATAKRSDAAIMTVVNKIKLNKRV
jgi:hypothetical protein